MDSYALEATSETWTPAHKAVETSDYETLSTLLDSGTDPDEVCFGHTLLTHAIDLEVTATSRQNTLSTQRPQRFCWPTEARAGTPTEVVQAVTAVL
ncbi:ankyrin repeat domain-containing protein [Streptomyces parvulus]|uniref:ankyrin repeat domain-containing protein n=1 Tax=Streptomyces parvulus TaxID=146923 RepID=UPI0033B82782